MSNNVDFESIFTKKHHYWRNMILVLVAAIVIAGVWHVQENRATTALSQAELKEMEMIGLENQKDTVNKESCTYLLPEELRNIATDEYYTNYHIDGSSGINIEWVASSQPPSEFSLSECPAVFFVSSDEFEGCGYRKEMNEGESNKVVNSMSEYLHTCGNEEIYLTSSKEERYDKFNLYLFRDKWIRITIFVLEGFADENKVLSNLGCVV
jgi:hypothetical protein